MSESSSLTPESIAEYDQSLAESRAFLEVIVSAYCKQRRQHAAEGLPEAVTVVGCAVWLVEEIGHEAVASALAVAILDIARRQP